jgi:hypothetical protein
MLQVREYCEAQFSKILAGRVSVSDLVFAKEVRRCRMHFAASVRCRLEGSIYMQQCAMHGSPLALGCLNVCFTPASPTGAAGHLFRPRASRAARRPGGHAGHAGGPAVRPRSPQLPLAFPLVELSPTVWVA